jgi:hypothetical protein
MEKGSIHSFAMELLAHYTKLDYELIKEAYTNPTYKIKKEPKKSGGFRTIHAPSGITKTVLKSLYQNFFKKFFYLNLISKHCCGNIKNKSMMDGIKPHTLLAPKFIIDIDIKDAFHCVNKDQIEDILLNIFLSEINEHRRRYFYYYENILHKIKYEKIQSSIFKRDSEEIRIENLTERQAFKKRMNVKDKWKNRDIEYWISNEKIRGKKWGRRKKILLFPNADYPDFRKLIRSPDHYDDVYAICKEMAEILSRITTCEGIMPQGYNTSPILMALMLSLGDILDLFEEKFLENKIPKSFVNAGYSGISVYVDSITVSIYDSEKNKSEITKELLSLMKHVELTSFWRFNMKKIHVYECEYENAMVTGLRLVKERKSRQDLKSLRGEQVKGARKALRHFTPWYGLRPTIPKNGQRKIRSVFYLAKKEENLKAEIINKARGYIAYIKYVYGEKKIPMQILKPMREFVNHLEKQIS